MSRDRSAHFPLPALVAGSSLLVLLAVGTTPAHAADEVVVDGVTYELVDDDPSRGARAVGYNPALNPGHPHLTLPSDVDVDGESVAVVEVANGAFRSHALRSVTVPGSVRAIGNFAFAYNTGLSSVTLADGVETLGTGSFRNNYTLETIDLPDTLTDLGHQAFFDNALRSIDVPESIDELKLGVFGRNALTHLELPAHVTKVRERAFAENDLASVVLHGGVTELGWNSFDKNPSLETVRFLGPEPEVVNLGSDSDPEGNPIATEVGTSPTIEFPWRHGEGQAASGGFTWPTWWGFDSVPVAEVTFEGDDGVHATRLVRLDQTGTGGPWGTLEAADMPDEPSLAGSQFSGWHDFGAGWTSGDPVTGDLVLSANWIDLSWVYGIEVTATPDEATVGEPVTLAAEGFNANGDSLGDITDEFAFDDPADSGVVLNGHEVTFTEEGTYTLSGWHLVTERPASIEIDVQPVSTTPNEEPTVPADEETNVPAEAETIVPQDEEPSVPQDEAPAVAPADEPETLPATGATGSAWTGVVSILALGPGAWLLAIGRRLGNREGVAL